MEREVMMEMDALIHLLLRDCAAAQMLNMYVLSVYGLLF
jgi:hypothetical protein